jgi:hypothetical protein
MLSPLFFRRIVVGREEYCMVRLRKAVFDRLCEQRDRLEKAYLKNQVGEGFVIRGISLSEMIDLLIKHRENDKRRMREAAARRRSRARSS